MIRRVTRWRPTPIIPLASFLVTYTTARDHDSCLGGLHTAPLPVNVVVMPESPPLPSSNIPGFLC